MQHTATPWGVGDGQIHPKGRALELGDICVFHSDGWDAMNPYATLAHENPETAKANAAFIVRAVNAHADLINALRQFISIYPSKVRNHPDIALAIADAEAALKLAEA